MVRKRVNLTVLHLYVLYDLQRDQLFDCLVPPKLALCRLLLTSLAYEVVCLSLQAVLERIIQRTEPTQPPTILGTEQ